MPEAPTAEEQCLACNRPDSTTAQVRCFECRSFVCQDCPIASHVKLCDRCGSYFCRNCDEMDQCDDCGEVVCGSCSTLLSCKFCGGGLCEDCATACGRRDAKFAVECDTCKLGYCLVCLASSTKEPCVRCGQRPSKRMEQLVHLRLKSIYKAFKGEKQDFLPPTTTTTAAQQPPPPAPPAPPSLSLVDQERQADAAAAALLAELDQESKKKKKKKRKKKPPVVPPLSPPRAETPPPSEPPIEGSPEQQQMHFIEPPVDPLQEQLDTCIAAGNANGIEQLLTSIKGVPGKALLRKHAKKALKRIKLLAAEEEETETIDDTIDTNEGPTECRPGTPVIAEELREILKVISSTHSKPTGKGHTHKCECVLHMAPSIVGWVIGKGGQRIRDLMDDSGARIWIDQDSMGPQDPRIVYVSGNGKNVEFAVDQIQDLVSQAPAFSSPRPNTPRGADRYHSKGAAGPAMPDVNDSEPTATSKGEVNLKPRGNVTAKEPRTKQILTCDPRFVPLLIGRRGWTIKNIQDCTKTKVDIDQTVTPRKITISGLESHVKDALRMVQDILSYPPSQLHPLPPEHMCSPTKEETVTTNPPDTKTTPVPARQGSPPSSLIMTADAKSTVSASSSLSSTPEPSVPSPGRTTVPPPLLGPGLFPANRQGLIPPPNSQQSPRMASPILAQQEFAVGQSLVNHSPVPVPIEQPRNPGVSPVPGLFDSRPPRMPVSPMYPPQHQQQQQSLFPQSVASAHIPSPAPPVPVIGNGRIETAPMLSPWNDPMAKQPAGLSTVRAPGGFRLDAAVAFLEGTPQPNEPMPPVQGPPMRPPQATAQKDDAGLIESLFSGTTGGNADSMLFNGMQGLSLNDHIGLWGSRDPKENPPFQDPKERSRFSWGETN